MMEIVTYIIGTGRSRQEREATRKAVGRVLDAMYASGSIVKVPSPYERGGFATYRIKADIPEHPKQEITYGTLGTISHSELRSIQEWAKSNSLQNPYSAYMKHKRHAAERGISFEMTFSDWWGIWESQYHLRGGRPDDLCMARKGDVGPYAVGNVYITTNRENSRDYERSEKKKRDLAGLKQRRHAALMELVREVESRPPPQYTYEQVIAMLKLGMPFELWPSDKVGHEVSAKTGALG